MRPLVPAVTDVDGPGALQVIYRETNPRYWRLIEEFREITGVPMVLNTSCNENEPVVGLPVKALDCLLRTLMSALVPGSHLVRSKLAPVSRDCAGPTDDGRAVRATAE